MIDAEIQRIAHGIYVIKPFKDSIKGKTRYSVQQEVDPFKQSCIWDEPMKGAEAFIDDKVCEFPSTHTFGCPSLFKPTLAEVIKACPEEYIGKFNAIRIVETGFTENRELHTSMVYCYNVRVEWNKDE